MVDVRAETREGELRMIETPVLRFLDCVEIETLRRAP